MAGGRAIMVAVGPHVRPMFVSAQGHGLQGLDMARQEI